MRWLATIVVPILFALRRLRARRLNVAVVAVSLAGACGLIGWSSVAAALSQEDNVQLRLAELPFDERALQVVYHLVAGESDSPAPVVADFFAELEGVAPRAHRVRLWHSVGPVRLVVADDPQGDVALTSGRLPTGCEGRVCEAVALAGDYRLGERVRLSERISARIVGRGDLGRQALPIGSDALPRTPDLTQRALLVRSLEAPLEPLARFTGSSVVTTAALDPGSVRGFRLRALANRLRAQLVRVERDVRSGEGTVPLALLDDLADRGEVARDRLLLVSGQAAALIVAFAAFGASVRRRESALVAEQLDTLGGSRVQLGLTRVVEAAVPCLAGAAIALVGLRVSVRALTDRRGLSSGFAAAALPAETLVAIAAAVACAVALLVASIAPRRPSRFGFGPLEVAALTSVAVVAWQVASTGALDPNQIQSGGGISPVLLVLPSLAFFATGVLLLRLLPGALRLLERLARGAPFSVRLAFLTAARRPAEAAAATTFLAVALGSAVFGLNYRATLEQHARDEAGFAAGAAWRVVEGKDVERRTSSDAGARIGADSEPATAASFPALNEGADVTPLTRFGAASSETPTPILRVEARLREGGATGEDVPVEVLALPAFRVLDVRGWRADFSELGRDEIARRLRPRPVRLAGLPLAPGARELRVWIRDQASIPRFAVLHFLRGAEQRFVHLRIGDLSREWSRVSVPLPAALRGSELVGVEFPPIRIPLSSPPDHGFLEVGPFEQRLSNGWSPLPSLDRWAPARGVGMVEPIDFASGPVRHAIQFWLGGTALALLHPPVPSVLPALVSEAVAAAAVDNVLTVDGLGEPLRVRVAGSARFFPTVLEQPHHFVVLDYETLFAVLNAPYPGVALPSEAWFFRPQALGFADRLGLPGFRVEGAVGAEPLTERLLSDPLASGTRGVLGVAALGAALLGLLGLVLAVRSALESERTLLGEYEALGVPPATLARSTQLRLFALSMLGVAAGLLGGLLAVRLIGASVAVTGAGDRPLPPIEPLVAWRTDSVLAGTVGIAALALAAVLARRTLRESAARRLRA